jgi:DNA-binding NarL/FixJ family response regulator
LARVRRLVAQSAPVAPAAASNLTPREREVLGLLTEGLELHEIANRLVITPKTVSKHIEHILGRLGVHNSRAETSPRKRLRETSPRERRGPSCSLSIRC